ncbi:MAG TPA: hypothetical protein VFT07_03025 [Sphingomicrobium sp.]|jgi:hypothetical protein|nr:hypothetical protein [Sphingomicrobium sp.]
MLGPLIFSALLFPICLYALWRGGRDERLVASLCLAGTLATMLAVSPLAIRYRGVEGGLALVDLGVLAGFVTVALTSQRFWPLWVAGFQLTTAFGHGLKAIDANLLPQAYGAALQFWAYPILIILAVGTWRRQRRLHRAAPR